MLPNQFDVKFLSQLASLDKRCCLPPFPGTYILSPVCGLRVIRDADSNLHNNLSHINDYCEISELNSYLPEVQSKNLQSLLHMNIHSLEPKLDILSANLRLLRHSFSVIACTETWTSANNEPRIDLPGYSKLLKSRPHGSGGDVALFFNNNLDINIKVRPDLSVNDSKEIESLFVQVKRQSLRLKDVIIGVIYHPPNADFIKFYDALSDILYKLNNEKRPAYLLGDFNMDLLKSKQDPHVQSFINLLFSNGFYPKINRPTRITQTTATLIDNIFTNVYAASTISGPLIFDISDHLPIYSTLPYNLDAIENHKPEYVFKRIYSEENYEAFKTKLASTHWSELCEV